MNGENQLLDIKSKNSFNNPSVNDCYNPISNNINGKIPESNCQSCIDTKYIQDQVSNKDMTLKEKKNVKDDFNKIEILLSQTNILGFLEKINSVDSPKLLNEILEQEFKKLVDKKN